MPQMRMQFMVNEEIGENRAITPQGFLLCTNVPLARTGIMNYAPGETPVRPCPVKGYVEIERSADEVFAPQSLASYTTAPFVDEHPPEDVAPHNWRDLAHGDVLNARRGDGELSECVVGDIVIKSPELIEAVNRGKREVSVGYTCDYDEMEPGKGRQRNIVVNHVALVDRGRCGPRCAIGDKSPQELEMNARTADDARRTVIANQQRGVLARCLDRLKAAVATKDEASIEQEIAAVEAATALTEQTAPGAGGPQIHLHLGDEFPPKKDDDDETEEEKKKRLEKEKAGDEGEQPNPLEARVGALEAGMSEIKELLTKLVPKEDESQAEQEQLAATLAAEAPPGTTDSAIKASTKDSAILQHSFRETVALAEILAPGLAVPTFDRALPPAKTFDSICRHRRAALSLAYQQPAMHKFIADAMPKGKTFDNMSCDETRHVFKSAAAVKAAINNAGNGKVTDVKIIGAAAKTHSPINSLADLNRVAKEKYKTVN